MSTTTQEKLVKFPILAWLIKLLKGIKPPGLSGLSAYDLLALYVSGVIKGTLSTRASAIAFSLFMALFPLIIFLISLIPYVGSFEPYGNDSFANTLLLLLESFLPAATNEYFTYIFEEINRQPHGGLLSSSFIVSLFLVANGVNAIFSGFEYSHHIKITRSFVRQYLYAFFVGLGLAVLLIFTVLIFVYFEFYMVPYLSELASKTTTTADSNFWILIGKTLAFFMLNYLGAAILYFFGTKQLKKARFFSVGALATAILIVLTSYFFGIYVEKIARYNELYGALGGLLILMIYIWLNSIILLLGFELNASLSVIKTKNKVKLSHLKTTTDRPLH